MDISLDMAKENDKVLVIDDLRERWMMKKVGTLCKEGGTK